MGIMPFLLVLRPYIMPFIMLHESREQRKLDSYVMFNKRVGVFYHNIKHDA
jgi:hypothetical protein